MKSLIPALLLLIIGKIQTVYSFTKYGFTVATIVASFSWLVIIMVVALIRLQKRRMQAARTVGSIKHCCDGDV